MTVFIRPEFTPGILPTYVGYHLQIFGAGRAKISLQTETKKKTEFYTALPKKDRDGLRRQKARSHTALPEHYAAIEQLLSDAPDAKVFRLYAKGDTNATADNAHVLASLEQDALWLVLSGVVHRWALTTPLVHVLLEGKGKRTGEASLFNEYMASYEHDWEDAAFELADYKVGQRDGGGSSIDVPQTRPTRCPAPQAVPKPSVPASTKPYLTGDDPSNDPALYFEPPTETCAEQNEGDPAEDYLLDDPDDPATFTDPPSDLEEELFSGQAVEEAWDTKTFKGGTAYGKRGLWAAYKDSGNQPGQHPTP